MRARRLAWTLASLLAVGCNGFGEGSADNRCSQSSDCPTSARCDEELEICVSEATSEPYAVVLRVSELPRSTSGLTRFTFPPFTLERSVTRELEVPVGIVVEGGVVDRSDPENIKAISAEVSFRPEAPETGVPVVPVVVQSSKTASDEEGTNLHALLAPSRMYEVTVQPLGEASSKYPPTSTSLRVDGGSARFEVAYANLDTFSATLLDEDLEPQVGRWVRIRSNETNQVVSSTSTVNPDGSLTLRVLDGVLDDPLRYTIEVNLDAENPWGETILVDPRRVKVDSRVLMIPSQPAKVVFKGSVEAGELSAVPLADLTFVSHFPVPAASGDVRGRDWCRPHRPSTTPVLDEAAPYRCTATVNTSTDPMGHFSVRLLPGDYDVFIVPSRETDKQRARTLATLASIETQPGGAPQQGQAFPLERASVYRGSVLGLDGGPVPNAAVRMVALGLTGTLGPVAAYNRSTNGLTDDQGEFQLAVDTGYFDIVTQPPDDSGYPWVYLANKDILSSEESLVKISRFRLPAPVLVRGRVASGGVAQAGARVDAYAIVKNIVGGQRGVVIGTATTDADGSFVLTLPPSVSDGTEGSDDDDDGSR